MKQKAIRGISHTPPRILFILNNFGMGGSERQLYELCVALQQGGAFAPEITFFGRHRQFLDTHGAPGIPVHSVPKYRRAYLPQDLAGFACRLRDHIRQRAPDVLVTWNASAGFWGGLAGVLAGAPRLVLSERRVFYRVRLKDRLRDAFIIPHAHAMVLNAHAGIDWAVRAKGIPRGKVRVLENGIDLGRFRGIDPAAVAQRRAELLGAEDAGGPLMGVLARLYVEKRHDLLLDAFADGREALPNGARLALIGGGPCEADLRAQAADRGIMDRVRFLGETAPAEVPALLSACDVTVLPSDLEGFPNAILESLAAGVPVVATAICDNARIVREGKTGRLVPAGNRDALREALLHASRSWLDPATRARMRAHALETVGAYAREGLVARATALFREILAQPARRTYPRQRAAARSQGYADYWPAPPGPVPRLLQPWRDRGHKP